MAEIQTLELNKQVSYKQNKSYKIVKFKLTPINHFHHHRVDCPQVEWGLFCPYQHYIFLSIHNPQTFLAFVEYV